MPRVMKCLVYIGVAAFLHQLPRFFDRRYVPQITVWRGHFEEVCRIEMAPWVHAISLDAYFITYYGFRVLFVHLIPCTSLVVLNVLLFRAMRTAQINRQRLFKENRKSECRKLRDSNCTTLMLIVVVTVFLLVEIPVAVFGDIDITMTRGFFITTLLISTAASGICRPGRQYPKEPTIICGSVTTMENNIIDIANENANINFGSTTVMDGNNPCQGINYVRQMGTTYNGENSLPNENTSLRETHESYTGSDPGTWKSSPETYDGENFLPNENTSLRETHESYTGSEAVIRKSSQSPETYDGENFLPNENTSVWETSESYTEANPETWKFPITSEIFGLLNHMMVKVFFQRKT
ncbi:hypothetical protein B5X24_HaOG209292 [Helicoverpa armigera]|nr:hypothetical protein B5X24_HaOG209292 [Helicoverpa armigera]